MANYSEQIGIWRTSAMADLLLPTTLLRAPDRVGLRYPIGRLLGADTFGPEVHTHIPAGERQYPT